MLGFSAIAEAAIACLPVTTGQGRNPVRGFTLVERRRSFELGTRSRHLVIASRNRVIGGSDVNCCINGGAICKTAGETEWLFFNFANRLGEDRSIVSVAAPSVSPSGLTANNQAVIDEDLVIDDDTTLKADTAVRVKVSGGTAGQSYDVRVTVTCSDGAILQGEGTITVEA